MVCNAVLDLNSASVNTTFNHQSFNSYQTKLQT